MQAAEALAASLSSWSGSLFAVIDGAKYPNVAAMLNYAQLRCRPLLLNRPGLPMLSAAPFLVPLDQTELGRLLQIGGISSSCVFWIGPVSEAAIYHHLRTINQAEIPRDAGGGGGRRVEIVLFRHWDPSVLSLMLPILEPAQRSQLFGPLTRVVLYSEDLGQVLQADRRLEWPAPERGRLRLSQEQITRLEASMTERSHRTVGRYLRETAPDQTASMDEPALLRFVADSESAARSWGVTGEAGIGRFAWLMLATGGTLTQMTEVRDWVAVADGSADDRLRDIMTATSREMAASSKTP
jgi:hypothetical protein